MNASNASNASNATKATEQSRRQNADLDSCYGKIGISAVVAALHYQGEQHNTAESRFTPYDND